MIVNRDLGDECPTDFPWGIEPWEPTPRAEYHRWQDSMTGADWFPDQPQLLQESLPHKPLPNPNRERLEFYRWLAQEGRIES